MPSTELQMIIEMARAIGGISPDAPLEDQRSQYELAVAGYALGPDVELDEVDQEIDGGGRVRGEWVLTPGVRPSRTVLYLHGGGYVIGGPTTHRELASRIGSKTSAAVFLLDYRLAPENPFPAAIDDAVAGYRWLLDSGRDPGQMLVAGDSAGGGLGVALLAALRDAGVALPAGAVLMSPWVDLTNSGSSQTTRSAEDPIVSRASLDRMAEWYLAGHSSRDPLASPLFGDLGGLPPLLVQVGTAEVLYDDAERLVAKALAAGVDAAQETFDGCIHVFQQLAAMTPEAGEALDSIGDFARRILG